MIDTASLIGIIQESLYWIIVFGALLGFSIVRGLQSLKNLILGLYLALLVSLKFPYYGAILNGGDDSKSTDSIIIIIVFAAFTAAATFLFGRLMRRDSSEGKFEDFWKKIIFALAGSVLIMAYSYHALPITDLITPGSPIQALFGSESNFFWWLLAPLIAIFIL